MYCPTAQRTRHASASRWLVAALIALALLAVSRAAAAAAPAGAAVEETEPCGLVWRAGDALWQLAPDGTPRELVRADAPVLLWAPSAAGHVAWIAGGRLYARPAEGGKARALGPKALRKGRFTHPIALEFGVSHLVVTLVDPTERTHGPFSERFRDELLVPLPRNLQSGPPPASLPTAVLCAGVGECEPPRPRSPGGRYLVERTEQAAHDEAFPRLFRKAMRREDRSLEVVDLLAFNRARGHCTDPAETRCAVWELDSWGWLPGDHVWARLKDVRTDRDFVAVALPADGAAAVVDGVALTGARGDPQGTHWVLGALVCCDDGRCVRLPDDALDAGWLPQAGGSAVSEGP